MEIGFSDRSNVPYETTKMQDATTGITHQEASSTSVSIRNDVAKQRTRETEDELARRRFVSRHGLELDRIRGDVLHSRAHPVPFTRSHKLCCRKSEPTTFPRKSFSEWMDLFLPSWRWLKNYAWKTKLSKDLVAGLTVGVMVIPQSMSYARLANLPVQYGLYSALVPVYAYALFGSSRQLAVGPVAIISLLLSTGLSSIMSERGFAVDDPSYDVTYNRLAVQTSFLVGVVYILMGVFRLGFVTIFLSQAVISGFTMGAAAIIGASQLKHIVGYNIERSDRVHEILYHLFAGILDINFCTFLMGAVAISVLTAIKTHGRNHKQFRRYQALGPLIVSAASIGLVAAFKLDKKGIPVVGSIPRGLPTFDIDVWSGIDDKLVLEVISIVIAGFMESIAIAKQLASKHKYEIDASQELIGLGMANFCGSMFQAYPVTGSLSRSAINHESGAQSGIAAVVTATLVMLVLMLLTPIFELLPLSILSVIVISAVLSLVDCKEPHYLWKVCKFDFLVWTIACFGTMFLGVKFGLAIAVLVSLLVVVYESAYPHTAVLGRLPGTTVYRNVEQYPEAERYDGIVVTRIDAPLFFANAQNVRDEIRKYRLLAEKEISEQNVRYLVIDLTPVSHIDTTALRILEDMLINYRSRDQQLVFSNPSLKVMECMDTSGFSDRVGREHFFSCSHDAVNWCLQRMDVEMVAAHDSSSHGYHSLDGLSNVSPTPESASSMDNVTESAALLSPNGRSAPSEGRMLYTSL